MGKIIALYVLLLVGNIAFLAWLYWSRRRGSGETGSRGGVDRTSRDTGSRLSRGSDGILKAQPAPGPADGKEVVYRDQPDTPERNEADTEPCPAPTTMPEWPRRETSPFVVPPMVQIGRDATRLDAVEIIFFTHPELLGFTVKAFSDRQLVVSELSSTPICIEGVPPHRRWSCTVSGLLPGEKFKYWVIYGGKVVFETEAAARKAPGSPQRIVVVGDMGNGSVESTRIAHRIYADYKPDLLAITGDVVYMHGRASEYLRRFLPVYNALSLEAGVGAPLLSQVLSFTSVGNHCVGRTEYYLQSSFTDYPDLHAFFMYWSLPLNGPLGDANAKSNIPVTDGDRARVERFLKVAGDRFPRMANYSFDDGDVHWLVLDANAYMDWTDQQLRDYVDKDLTAAKAAKWKFVNFHQPSFTSNPKHGQEKRMRLLSDLFQKHGVDIVFCGHAHYYERTYPLRFTVEPRADGALIDAEGFVGGEIALDKAFDGETVTKPNGVIYIVTGGGGAKLDPSGIHWRKEDWKPFTHKLIGDRHSFTVCDIDGTKLTLRQIDMSGKEIDRLVITK